MAEPCPWTCSRPAPTSGLPNRKQTNRHTRFLDQSPPIVNCSAADWRLVWQVPITRKRETDPLPIGGAACRDCRGAPIIECYRIRLKAGEMLSSGASARKPADAKNAKARFDLGALRWGPSKLRVN